MLFAINCQFFRRKVEKTSKILFWTLVKFFVRDCFQTTVPLKSSKLIETKHLILSARLPAENLSTDNGPFNEFYSRKLRAVNLTCRILIELKPQEGQWKICYKRRLISLDAAVNRLFDWTKHNTRVSVRVARCHVFKPKILIWVNFGGTWNGRFWSILWPFGLFWGHLVYLMVIWNFFPVLVSCLNKNLATLVSVRQSVTKSNFLKRRKYSSFRSTL
jgi:hypothetical protein